MAAPVSCGTRAGPCSVARRTGRRVARPSRQQDEQFRIRAAVRGARRRQTSLRGGTVAPMAPDPALHLALSLSPVLGTSGDGACRPVGPEVRINPSGDGDCTSGARLIPNRKKARASRVKSFRRSHRPHGRPRHPSSSSAAKDLDHPGGGTVTAADKRRDPFALLRACELFGGMGYQPMFFAPQTRAGSPCHVKSSHALRMTTHVTGRSASHGVPGPLDVPSADRTVIPDAYEGELSRDARAAHERLACDTPASRACRRTRGVIPCQLPRFSGR